MNFFTPSPMQTRCFFWSRFVNWRIEFYSLACSVLFPMRNLKRANPARAGGVKSPVCRRKAYTMAGLPDSRMLLKFVAHYLSADAFCINWKAETFLIALTFGSFYPFLLPLRHVYRSIRQEVHAAGRTLLFSFPEYKPSERVA